MRNALKIALASTASLAIAAPALAQYQTDQSSTQYQSSQQPAQDYQRYTGPEDQNSQYQPTPQYQRQQEQYREEQQRYQQQRRDYDDTRSAYNDRRQGYNAARAAYERRLAAYNRARADYDRRYGYGAYVRVYGPPPVWDETHWAYYLPAPAAPYYGANTAYTAPPVHCDNSGTVTAGAIGALAGAVLGSQVSAPGRHTENSVLGALIGGGIGAAVGHAHDKYKCDQRGPYFTYQETVPYREGAYRSPRYAEYERMGCRLAAAPTDRYGRDYRYIRVCPDPDGRYRIVG